MEEIVNRIVNDILLDLTARNGIGNEWYAIDDDIQEEIIEEWKSIINKHLK